jgi:hypothetical protein
MRGKSSDATVAGEDAMARNDDRDRVVRQRLSDGACRAGRTDPAR